MPFQSSPPGPAPQAASHARIEIGERTVHAVVQLPLDEMDLLLRLDRDLDGQVSGPELAAARDRIGAYLAKHLRVVADARPLALTLGNADVRGDAGAVRYLETSVDGRAAAGIATVAIQSDFLTELSAAHATQGEIRIGSRTETFLFRQGAVYEHRLRNDRATSALLVAAGLLVIGALSLARRRGVFLVIACVLAAGVVHADVILSAPRLNAVLKTMEKLTREASADAIFSLAVEADALAALMNQEVESHGMQERELLDLALGRTKALGIAIAYNREKKKFFYDGAAFRAYLREEPRGAHAAEAEFALLSYQFYQASAADAAALEAASEAKQRFLARYPRFRGNADVRLFLAVDYQDLFRRAREAHDAAAATKYRGLMREECARIERLYPRTEQADAARQLLRKLQP